ATTEIYTLSLHDALPIYPCHPDASNSDGGTCDQRQHSCPGVTGKPRVRLVLRTRGEQRVCGRCHFREEAKLIQSGSVLVINCGSSSINNFSVIDDETSGS